MTTYACYDIVWDKDEEDFQDLPDFMLIDLDDEAEPSLELADAVSDRTGWCVISLRYHVAIRSFK